jgi:AcrR family transcriptional regulator
MPAPARPRENQRNRTRAALLAAAGALMREGRRPSIPDVAAAAGIARRTAYRYFPSAEQLHTEAALETLRPAMEGALATMSGANPEARLETTVREMQRLAAQNEDLLRAMIRLTVDRRADEQTTGHAPVRGSRRIDWLEASLAPIRSRLTPRAFARLVSAVSLCVGAEALIVLRDVRGLDEKRAADVSSWAATALLRASLAEPGAKRTKPRSAAKR